jgi:hypothetical protein
VCSQATAQVPAVGLEGRVFTGELSLQGGLVLTPGRVVGGDLGPQMTAWYDWRGRSVDALSWLLHVTEVSE